jgi:hypothetical protein
MRQLIVGVVIGAAAAAGVVLLRGGMSAASAETAITRTADGKPDLSGIWQALGTAHWDLEDHSGRAPAVAAFGAVGAVPAGRSVVEGGEIPYKPEMMKKRAENAANWITLDPEVKCYLPGVPRAMYQPFPFQIVQGTDVMLMAFEFAGATRPVYMTKVEAPPIDTWMGHSLGRFEGDTLVIESNTFNDLTWFDRAGNFHSDALKVVERITPRNRDVLNYEATIEDPNVFTRPWKISLPLYRRLEPQAEVLEFNCVEFVEETLWGHLKKKTTK